MGLFGDRYLRADEELARADIVHAAELSFWFAGEAARPKAEHGFKLVLTVWETIPFLGTYRNRLARDYREQTLAGDRPVSRRDRTGQGSAAAGGG